MGEMTLLPGGEPRRGAAVMPKLTEQHTVFLVPLDGREHTCPCGQHTFRASTHDGWVPDGVVHHADDGRPFEFCPGCDRDLKAAA